MRPALLVSDGAAREKGGSAFRLFLEYLDVDSWLPIWYINIEAVRVKNTGAVNPLGSINKSRYDDLPTA